MSFICLSFRLIFSLVDIIRNQIYQFVNTKTLFGNGMKFVILDEVDYMTKKADNKKADK